MEIILWIIVAIKECTEPLGVGKLSQRTKCAVYVEPLQLPDSQLGPRYAHNMLHAAQELRRNILARTARARELHIQCHRVELQVAAVLLSQRQ